MADEKTRNRAHRAPDDGSGGAGKEQPPGEARQTTSTTRRPAPGTDYRARFFNSRDIETYTGYDPKLGW